jgi:sodium-coupled neutral amino acid transporter 7/8
MKAETKQDKQVGALNSGSNITAILALAKGTLGAGILALPQKTMLSGIPVFLTLLCVSGFFTAKSIEMIAVGARRSGKFVFEEITEVLLGRVMAIVLGVSMLLNCYGASIVFVIAIKGAFVSLFTQVQKSTGQDWPLYATLIVGAVVLIPLSIVERINSLRLLSLSGVIGVFFTVASVVYSLSYLGVADNFGDSVGATIMKPEGGFIAIMTVVSTVTFAFCNQFNVPQVYQEMTDKTEKSVTRVAYISTMLPMILYIITAITGYLCYGLDIEDNILLNMEPLIDAGKLIIYIGVIAVALSVSMCHLLNNFPMRLSVLFFLPEHYQSNKWIRYSVPLFTAVSTIAIALVYSELSMFLGLVGASTGSIICYIVPALFSIRDAQIESDIKKQVSPQEKRWYSLILNHPTESTMILVGIVIGFVGTFCEFYAAFSPKDE